jgi:hypothetical protein
MKKCLILLFAAGALSGCVGMSSTDGDSTKNWIKIESSKSDLEGGVDDVCYRLDVSFSPAEAAQRINTDLACISKCCWYSERKVLDINLNDGFASELIEKGAANRYSPEKLTIYLSYSSFLGAIHGKMTPKVINSGGLITLDYVQIKDQDRYLTMGYDTIKAQSFEDVEENAHESSYLFKAQQQTDGQKAATATIKTPEQQAEIQAAAPAQTQETELEGKAQPTFVLVEPQYSGTNGLSDQQREELYQKRIAYERAQVIDLLKRFYAQDIDDYILHIDKEQKAKGQILLANDRQWSARKIGSPIYRITCMVKGKIGSSRSEMKDYPIDCGLYEVDLGEKTVYPRDSVARSIISGEYKN